MKVRVIAEEQINTISKAASLQTMNGLKCPKWVKNGRIWKNPKTVKIKYDIYTKGRRQKKKTLKKW